MTKPYRNRFRLVVATQVVLLVATIVLLAWTILDTGHVAVPIVIGIVVALQVWVLLRSVAVHVDHLEDFFAAVNFEDFTRRFVAGDLDAELTTAFNRIIEKFRDARAARDVQAGYLETVVRHVPVAFVAARADGSLRMVNSPARRLTGLATLQHLDDLAALDPALPGMLANIEPGRQQLLQTRLRDVPAELRVSVAEIRLSGQSERLYALENLSAELTARESSAWRNLIRVLTHEIMNTLTPVTSLAETCRAMLDDPAARDDLREAVATIARRSEGLTRFVASYRELLQVPQPHMQPVAVRAILDAAIRLMAQELRDVEVETSVEPASLTVEADSQLLDQVLLNLLRNSADALLGRDDARLRIGARLDYGHVLITVHDNGSGIAADVIDQVFVPFFTTKRHGSGIGLSLCRQIMTAHGGDLAIASNTDGTTATLTF